MKPLEIHLEYSIYVKSIIRAVPFNCSFKASVNRHFLGKHGASLYHLFPSGVITVLL